MERYCDMEGHQGHPLTKWDDVTEFPRWVGMVFFGPGYSEPSAATDCYVWDTLADVGLSVASIASGRGMDAAVAEWTHDGFGAAARGNYDDSLTPDARDPQILLWRNLPDTLRVMEEDGPVTADYVVHLGPRGGARWSTDLMAPADAARGGR